MRGCRWEEIATTSKFHQNEQARGAWSRPSRLFVQSLLLQLRLDALDDLGLIRAEVGLEAGDDLTVSADQELLEVPGNVAAGLRIGVLARQILVQRADALALDDDLGQHREADLVVVLAELGDLGVGAGLLLAE